MKLMPLIYSEMIVALDSLQEGGFFILKTFSLFHCNSLGLCYYLSQVFDSVHIAKPITSKAGNCEVYLVCIGFLGHIPRIHQQLMQLLYSSSLVRSLTSNSIFSKELLPLKFILNFQQAITLFTYKQKQAISNNLTRFKMDTKDVQTDLIQTKKRTCRKFFHLNKICRIENEARLVPKTYIPSDPFSYFLCHPVEKVRVSFKNLINYINVLESLTLCQGSLKERRKQSNEIEKNFTQNLIRSLCQQDLIQVLPLFSQWHSMSPDEFKYNITSGRKLNTIITNSKFVSSSLINLFKQIKSTDVTTFAIDKITYDDDDDDGVKMSHALDQLLYNVLKRGKVNPFELNIQCDGKYQLSPHVKKILSDYWNKDEEKKSFIDKVNTSSTLYFRHVTSFVKNTSPSYHLYPLEMEQFLDLLDWLQLILTKFTYSDLIVISVDHSLDRLTVGLMYLLCKLFSFYSVIPRSNKWIYPYESTSFPVPGHMFIFRLQGNLESHDVEKESSPSFNSSNIDFKRHINCNLASTKGQFGNEINDKLGLSEISSQFTSFKCCVNQHLQSLVNDESVLELLSVPKMLQGKYYLHLLFYIKLHSICAFINSRLFLVTLFIQ